MVSHHLFFQRGEEWDDVGDEDDDDGDGDDSEILDGSQKFKASSVPSTIPSASHIGAHLVLTATLLLGAFTNSIFLRWERWGIKRWSNLLEGAVCLWKRLNMQPSSSTFCIIGSHIWRPLYILEDFVRYCMAKWMGLQSTAIYFLKYKIIALCEHYSNFIYLKSEIHTLESTSLNFMSQNEIIYAFKV